MLMLVVLLSGINVHHMFPQFSGDYRDYAKQLEKLKDPLQRLASTPNVKMIWMLNQDIMDIAINPANYHTFPVMVHSLKTRVYNTMARKAFQKYIYIFLN